MNVRLASRLDGKAVVVLAQKVFFQKLVGGRQVLDLLSSHGGHQLVLERAVWMLDAPFVRLVGGTRPLYSD